MNSYSISNNNQTLSSEIDRIKIQNTILSELEAIESIIIRLKTLHSYWATDPKLAKQLEEAESQAKTLNSTIKELQNNGYKLLLKTTISKLEEKNQPHKNLNNEF